MGQEEGPNKVRRGLLQGMLIASAGAITFWGTKVVAEDVVKGLESKGAIKTAPSAAAAPSAAGLPFEKSRFPAGGLVNSNPPTSMVALWDRITAKTGLPKDKVKMVVEKLAPPTERFVLAYARDPSKSSLTNIDSLHRDISKSTGVQVEAVREIHAMSFRTLEKQTLDSKGKGLPLRSYPAPI